MSASEGRAERDRATAEVLAARPREVTAGYAVIQRWAASGEPFSANSIRSELAEAGVTGQYTAGALFRSAKQSGLIRRVSVVPSDSTATHAKEIGMWVGAAAPVAPVARDHLHRRPARTDEIVAVPVKRDDRGQFTAATSTDHPTLFDLEVSA